MCKHENFHADVKVARLTDVDGGPVTGFMAEITVKCQDCGKPFQFLGLQPGLDLRGARVSIDGLEANIAMVPQGTQPSPLQGLTGYRINSLS